VPVAARASCLGSRRPAQCGRHPPRGGPKL